MKKIAVCGKGGVGKSFMVYSLTKAFQKKGFNVCVVDTDESNLGLPEMLGIKETPLAFMEYLGGKKSVQQNMMKRFSSGDKEVKISVIEDESFPLSEIGNQYIADHGSIKFITIGKINMPMEGCACPMGAISREFLEKVVLQENEIMIVDTEAGVEHFGRGVEKGIDTVIAISEPTRESLSVAKRIFDLASVMDKKRYLIINKVPYGQIEDKAMGIARAMDLPVSGIVHYDMDVFNSAIEGTEITSKTAILEVEEILNKLI
ncbi:MAG TPA: P-loop NTPase [Spirochaetota bacterium]|jgi:CO dehydrogenase maturation factor|nr:P-loop NTPase [Spirochaetota bacterium]HON17175.1 P-loop NTPase [Spirochaetota bacterium]HPD78453.1 P-loop NTPase [Spirochaetota bacterium]HPP95165.1 P-loop NTPase [Spirochaetota bacterium]HRS63166.1 P-loop NTPase [Spirochaetota bacterium]